MPEIVFLSGLTEHSYCQYETFEATCPDNEVIIMRVARYGRIVIGPCVNADFGFLGCYSDVTKLMDRKCSGRKSCQVLVVDPTFGNIQPCNMEFKNYLEASYDCLQGENPTTSVTKWASTWWRHQMETFSALLAICAGNSPVTSPHKGLWRGALMFSLICVWINGWVNNREAGDLRRYRAHYDVTVMKLMVRIDRFASIK